MSYQVLARKWRPRSFDTLVGQDHVVRALSNALNQNRIHHAYLFTGTRGVGKTTLARILAKSLNCEIGITAKPCGVCAACLEIDKGRFVDLLEVDAASNTQVDAMRDLLDNAQYAPTSGRFKVYIIDEVHMLSKSAFNAMLKTLEEPPAHVKFILATTDPQKVPVTVLSRCLQFNLRQMATTSIIDHLQNILTQENIPYQTAALHMIARAAAGSMRDALSLTDQAIAYGGQQVNETEVRAMLGAIDQSYLYQLIAALLATDGNALLDQAKIMQERSLSFEAALNDLAQLLHQIAVAQTVPESIPNDLPDRPVLIQLAQTIQPETLQLYYQIAILGRRDIGLAPDEYAGFTMTLLRMLSFTPNDGTTGIKLSSQAANKPAVASMRQAQVTENTVAELIPQKKATVSQNAILKNAVPTSTINPAIQESPVPEHQNTYQINGFNEKVTNASEINAEQSEVAQTLPQEGLPLEESVEASFKHNPVFNGDWRRLVNELKLGLAKALAQQCELVSYDEHSISLSVPETQKHLLLPNYQEKLSSAIAQYYGKKIRLQFSIGGTGNTPAKQILQEKAHAQANAVTAIEEDSFVQALINDFGAQIIPNSIKPIP